VSKQLAIWAMAIQGRLTVEDMVNADLPYAPPFSLAIDHSVATAHIMQNKIKGRMHGISACEVKTRLDAGQTPFILDVRGSDEYARVRLGIGEHLIPIDGLRGRLDELPSERHDEIICFCHLSLRAYEAERILVGRGWTNVKVMEGGIAAWPYARDK
jgi:rhodanese-related sulfurtransferase